MMKPDHRRRRVRISRSGRGPEGTGVHEAFAAVPHWMILPRSRMERDAPTRIRPAGIVEEDVVAVRASLADRACQIGAVAIVDHLPIAVARLRLRGLFGRTGQPDGTAAGYLCD